MSIAFPEIRPNPEWLEPGHLMDAHETGEPWKERVDMEASARRRYRVHRLAIEMSVLSIIRTSSASCPSLTVVKFSCFGWQLACN